MLSVLDELELLEVELFVEAVEAVDELELVLDEVEFVETVDRVVLVVEL